MRLNKFIALATGLSRRAADQAIGDGRVAVNGLVAQKGTQVHPTDDIRLDEELLKIPGDKTLVMVNKPRGYVCSRRGQGSRTIYDLLPGSLKQLKPVGRLDKDSTGLILLTNDGDLANKLTHPRFKKEKIYEIRLDKPLAPADQKRVLKGVQLEDGTSQFSKLAHLSGLTYKVSLQEGRNRQIRRTFAALGYKVVRLHRTKFGVYELGGLKSGDFATAERFE